MDPNTVYQVIAEIKADLAVVRAHSEDTKQVVEKIRHTLDGNGTPGIKTRLDRLEIATENRKWLMRTAVGAAVVSCVSAIWNAIIHG